MNFQFRFGSSPLVNEQSGRRFDDVRMDRRRARSGGKADEGFLGELVAT
jgi:hypothetical protein